MSWATAFEKFGHRIFIAYIELKIDGPWRRHFEADNEGLDWEKYEILVSSGNNCTIHIIEPDGLRRILAFTDGGTLTLHENILSYHPDQVSEIAVDEKAQAGKGKTRDILS